MSGKILIPVLLGSVVMIVLLQLGFIFLLLAMLPTIVAYYIDSDARKTSFKIVFAGNFAAALPTLMPMLRISLQMKHYDVATVLQDPNVWLFVYLGAAAGWCLIFLCRFIARFIITLTYEYTISTLTSEQKRLVEEWGQDIMMPIGGKKSGYNS